MVLAGVDEPLTRSVLGAAIEVHRYLGPGLLESAYEVCLCDELGRHGMAIQRQVPLPVSFKGRDLDCGYRLDVVVEGLVVLELKAIDALQPIHEAQLLTYLRLGRYPVGFLINFHSAVLKDGVKRMVL